MPTVTLNCIADTFTPKVMPNNTFGNEDFIYVYGERGTDDDFWSYGWLRFNISSLPSDFDWGNVTGAELKLYLVGVDTEHGKTTLFIFRKPESGWNEYTLTWNNQPTTTTKNSQGNIVDDDDLNTYVSFSFSKDEILSLKTNGTIDVVVVCMKYEPPREFWFGSRESSQPPLLEITYSAPDCVDCVFPVEDENGNPLSGVSVTADRAPTWISRMLY